MSDSEGSSADGGEERSPPKKRKSGKRPKKRKFAGNKYVDPSKASKKTSRLDTEAGPSTEPSTSASYSKLSTANSPDEASDWAGYRILDRDLMFAAIEEHCRCPCGGTITMEEKATGGLSSRFFIKCKKCEKAEGFNSCSKIGAKKNVSEVNRRSVFAMRSLGMGHRALQKFCAHMELPPSVEKHTFQRSLQTIHAAVQKEAGKSMKRACQEEAIATGSTEVGVSGDGTWQRRGHTSLNGVCTIIGLKTGKVMDVEVLSKLCHGCARFGGETDSAEYEEWWESHQSECQQNHQGSAGKMEADGMVEIFKRSEETRGLVYSVYCGDQDSKTFKCISESNPYKTKVTKKECCGHIKKKMGRWLRNLKQSKKGVKLSDGKGLFGRGRLTDASIDKIQQYYGQAIVSNADSVEDMRKAIWAIFYHMQATDAVHNHTFCPKGPNSWCKYQVAVYEKREKDFVHKKPDIPPVCLEACRSVFEELSKPDLLNRCLGAHTQNNNESLNQLIWRYAPKIELSGRRVVEVATFLAVLDFNEGQSAKEGVLGELGMKAGKFFRDWAKKTDEERISKAEEKSEKAGFRRAKRMLLKQREAAVEEEEGLYYDPGSF